MKYLVAFLCLVLLLAPVSGAATTRAWMIDAPVPVVVRAAFCGCCEGQRCTCGQTCSCSCTVAAKTRGAAGTSVYFSYDDARAAAIENGVDLVVGVQSVHGDFVYSPWVTCNMSHFPGVEGAAVVVGKNIGHGQFLRRDLPTWATRADVGQALYEMHAPQAVVRQQVSFVAPMFFGGFNGGGCAGGTCR